MIKSVHETTANELFNRKMSRTEKRRLQIVETAIDLFAKKGFDEVSFEIIAARCKVTRPLISHYFENKMDLFLLVAKYVRIIYQKNVVSEMQKTVGAEEVFKAYVMAALQWHSNEPMHFRVWMLYYYLSSIDSKMKKEHSDLVDLGTERIVEMLTALPKQAVLPKEVLRKKARLIQMTITGSLIAEASEGRVSEDSTKLQEYAYIQCCEIAGVP